MVELGEMRMIRISLFQIDPDVWLWELSYNRSIT